MRYLPALLLVGVAALVIGGKAYLGSGKVSVCHAGADGTAKVIDVGTWALSGHLAHDDYIAKLSVDPTLPLVAGQRFHRITDAVDAVRAGRLARDERTTARCRIEVRIAPREFVGAFEVPTDPLRERLPIVIDVPDVTLHGDSLLAKKPNTSPIAPPLQRLRTVLRPERPLTRDSVGEALIVVVGHPGGATGDGAEIRGLTFDAARVDTTAGGFAIITLRARRLLISENRILGRFSSAIDLRESDADVIGNVAEGLGPACTICASGPGRYTLRGNRLTGGQLGGILIVPANQASPIATGAAPAAVIEPSSLPASSTVEVEVSENVVTGHQRIPIAFALRVMGIGRSASAVPGLAKVRVRDNDFRGNTFGVIVDAGFAAPNALNRSDLVVELSGNRLAPSCQAALLVAFTRHTGAIGQSVNPFLRDSRISISLGGDILWNDAWYSHRAGFGNTLEVDAVEQPNGQRSAYDATRTCP